MLDVIEDDQVVAEEQEHVGDFQLLLCGLRQALDESNGVVAEVADSAAGEAGQSRDLDGPALGQQAADRGKGIALAPFQLGAVACTDDELVSAGAQRQRGPHAEEAVAAHLLALLDGLQQEGRAAVSQLEIDRNGRFEIGGQLAENGDGIAAGRQLLYFLQRRTVGCHRNFLSHCLAAGFPLKRKRPPARHFLPMPGDEVFWDARGATLVRPVLARNKKSPA